MFSFYEVFYNYKGLKLAILQKNACYEYMELC